MRIIGAHVTNYRSVIDSEAFEVEEGKTILVGVNEAGKTAILKALQSINPPKDAPLLDFLADYPRSKLNDIQRGHRSPAEIQIAEATFSLDAADRAAVANEVTLPEDATITWHRYLDNTLKYSLRGFPSVPALATIKQDLLRLRAHLVIQGAVLVPSAAETPSTARAQGALESFLSEIDELHNQNDRDPVGGKGAAMLQKILTAAVPLVDEDNDKEMSRLAKLDAISKIDAHNVKAKGTLLERLPLLVYYSTYFTVRPRIDLESLAARQERGDIDNEYDFGNLCLLKLLGFTSKELSTLATGAPIRPTSYESDASVRAEHDKAVIAHQRNLDNRQYQLNAASVTLTQDLRRVWGDDALTLRIFADGQYLKVMVVDDLGVEVELDQRSEGFRWLVSFFVVFRSQAEGALEGAVLLVDEPGLSLHALKQQEFRKTISLLGEDNQIIYSTHSPFMVGSDELDLVRIVEMKSRLQGTKVHTRLQVDDPRSIFPLQAALGYELAQSMFSQKRNLVCEGVTDMFYLNATNESAKSDGGASFRNSLAVIPAGTASKVAYFCTIYAGQNLQVAALLDSDNAGDQAAQQDALVALLPKKAVLRIKDFLAVGYSGAEIEDLFRETIGSLAKGLGWDSVATITAQPQRPIVEILVQEHGKGVSKWKLAKAFTAWLGSHGFKSLPTEEQIAWGRLVSAVNKVL
ncbi:OLD family endonuclease [Cryobacterium melibiosiphilum]|uniref:OLD family endonuclease n=1 Tax=Cryobacterium melibiosiphilum TaxID=995039 RepID=A0A3A5MMQ2_9MICO|nr:AAA family ATPase [Cryobacterium melibiosiphilum]RJT90275.1 OLD family endonuclease [Cryobacterium melibiosiphilum]